jgi:hypothetical protein
MDNQGTAEETLRELSAREIFNRIIKGHVVRMSSDLTTAMQLKNHLNVIKSREKKLFVSLGLDFISSIVSVKPTAPAIGAIMLWEFKLDAPKQRRKFSVFTINSEQQTNEQPNTV